MAKNAFFDFRNWHRGPDCERTAVSCHGGVGVMLLCLSCGVAADLQAMGGSGELIEISLTSSEYELVGAGEVPLAGRLAGMGP